MYCKRLQSYLCLVTCALSLGYGWADAQPTSTSSGQAYPSRPIRWIIPFSPGGPSDIIGRFFATKLTDALGKQVVIDNRGGATGIIACDIAAHSAPDGYTVLQGGASALTVNPHLHAKLPYDVNRDFRLVTQLVATPNILVVHPGMPARTVKDLIALAKAKPGELTFASGGTGTSNHLSSEMLKYYAGIKLVHVPFKGTGPALTSVLGGQVQMMFSNMLPAMPHVRAGRLYALAVTSVQRSSAAPEVPTVAESGFPGFETTSWHGVVVPAGTPTPIVRRLYEALKKITQQADVKDRFAADGTLVIGSTPEEYAAIVKSESAKWARIIKAAGIKAEQ
jgi:tripartite-type tricarboxylate transporter receptor subunit TctC